KSRFITGDDLRCIVLEDSSQDKFGLQLGEGHTYTHARPASKGEVRSWWDLLSILRIPTLRSEYLGISPDVGQTVDHPLAEHEQRPNGKVYAVQLELFGDETHLHPGWRIQTHRLAQYPIEVGKPGK